MWGRHWYRSWQRRAVQRRVPAGPLADYLAQPPPDLKLRCREVDILAVDLETTGLDPQRDRILSIGAVPIRAMQIELGQAWQVIVQAPQQIPESSVVIHRITDDVAAAGNDLQTVMPQLLSRLAGNVLLAHHALIETGFLDQACRQLYGAPLPVTVVDTEQLARRRLQRRNLTAAPGGLRLFNLRRDYGLPRYRAHNALSDALATAELFLAMAAEIAPGGDCRLRDILSP